MQLKAARFFFEFMVALLVTYMTIATGPVAAQRAAADTVLGPEIARILAVSDDNDRTLLARDLYWKVKTGKYVFSSSDIPNLRRLMRDDFDAVRFWIAGILGTIGPAAREAAPELKSAYIKIACARGDLTSVGMVETALDRIGEKIPKVVCEGGRPPRSGKIQ